MYSNFTPQYLAHLRRGIIQCFDTEELKSLCIDLGIDYQNLSGDTKEAKARELILYLNRRNRLSELVTKCLLDRPEFLWSQVETNIVSSVQNSPTHDQLTILFLSAAPTDTSRLRSDKEFHEIQAKLQLAQLRNRFNLQLRLAVRAEDISQALLDTHPHIIHFSGHGSIGGALHVENEKGETQLIAPDSLAALFNEFSSQIHCVILNACYSEIQAKAIAKYVKYVIGMNETIGDTAAIAFAIGFYQGLGAGRTFDEAYRLGQAQIRLQGISEYLAPSLLKHELLQ